jgi:hypothetical protein
MRWYDLSRGLTTLLGAGAGGLLVWLATRVGQGTTLDFWAAMGLIAAAGLVMAASQLLGGWTKFGWPRLSLPVLLVGFLPVLVCVGWVLMATQPGSGWHEGRVVGWSHDIGVFGVVRELGLYHGVLAFAFGLVLGFSFDTNGLRHRDEVVVDETRSPAAVPVPASAVAIEDRRDLDEPLTAERETVTDTGRRQRGPLVGTYSDAPREIEIREGGAPVKRRPDPDEELTELD